jgi:iron complex transport system ATP-binding protein
MTKLFSMESVSLRRDGKELLRDMSWEISAGQHWALLGPNGSGKSLTLQLMLAHIWASKGRISLLGHELGTYDVRELRKEIGWLNEPLRLRFCDLDARVEEVLEANLFFAGKGGERDFEVSFPEKLPGEIKSEFLEVTHLLGRRFRTLSYGEQKRVLLSRALKTRPSLLILDEPCSGLDPGAREQFLQIVQGVAEGLGSYSPTLVMVTHHLEDIVPAISHCHLISAGETIVCGEKHSTLTEENLNKTFSCRFAMEAENGRYWAKAYSLD